MAHRTFYVTKDVKHPFYKTRMLSAGDTLNLSGPDARTYQKLGVELSEDAPKKARPKVAEAPAPVAKEAVAAPKPVAKPKAKRTRKK